LRAGRARPPCPVIRWPDFRIPDQLSSPPSASTSVTSSRCGPARLAWVIWSTCSPPGPRTLAVPAQAGTAAGSPGERRPPAVPASQRRHARCRSCGDPRCARCSSPRPRCPQPARHTWSGAWPAGTGFPTLRAPPAPSRAKVRPQPLSPTASPLTGADARNAADPDVWCPVGHAIYASNRAIGAGPAVLILGLAELCSRARWDAVYKPYARSAGASGYAPLVGRACCTCEPGVIEHAESCSSRRAAHEPGAGQHAPPLCVQLRSRLVGVHCYQSRRTRPV
jgi:hypothetical protein